MTNYIYGKNPLKQLLADDRQRIKKVFVLPQEKVIIEQLKQANISYVISNKEQLLFLVKHSKNQGIVCLIKEYVYTSLEEVLQKIKTKKYPLILILDQIEDPRNFGAILRSCDAVNVDAVIILKQRQVELNATVAKTSVGAINYVPVVKVTNLSNTLTTLKENGFWIVASALNTEINYYNVDYKKPIALIVGNEGQGVSQKLLNNSDYIVKVPMQGHINSLNVAVASALLLYQVRNNQNN
ncbi:23S rRNA (guanosine(2251)-2'-O)-methyltransferase RlmB [Spiroplasma endosymbiont of 'Nebria riversi']|uniref:23S rRNA (guanosine(2251)-2'-O)-methyltransferase RlmB n=1 Tax=Spiroplasma endosymbiont of 'Nebria riversi' TaxID=2792084 RepID=UPI001C044AF0|nr:23S rRNA (guanosine(2251)-2'-O)-methyltransferase RlmB [Spiroplasma endosymbiont of 'Nebria riversi']